MKEKETKKLYNSVTNVREDYIEEAQAAKGKKKHAVWVRRGMLAACILFCIIAVSGIPDIITPAPENGRSGDTSASDIITANDLSGEQIIDSSGDFAYFTYDELKEYAASIVKVEVIDELTSANSLSHMDEDGYVTRACSVRTVRVLSIYKDSYGFSIGEEIKIQDWPAIYEEYGKIYMSSCGPEPLKKGNTYILYLEDGKTMSGYPCIVSGSLGQIDLNDLSEKAPNYDIMVKTIVEYESDWPEKLKQSVLEAENISNAQNAGNFDKENISIETAAGNVDAAVYIEEGADNMLNVYLDTFDSEN